MASAPWFLGKVISSLRKAHQWLNSRRKKSNQASVKCKLAHLTCSSAAISPVDLGGESAGEEHLTISAPSAGLRWFSATELSVCTIDITTS